MAITTQLGKQLYQKCQLDRRKQELELEKLALEEQLPQAKAARREADNALFAYTSGGFRPFLDKLSGKWEDTREDLTRKAAHAQGALQSLQRELEAAEGALKEVDAQLHELGEIPDVVELAQDLEKQEREAVLCKAAWVSAEKLIPLLEMAAAALEEAQEWARPNNRIDTFPGYTKGILLAKAEGYARQCHDCLQQIARCGILLEIHPYFSNPSGYIHGVAAQYAELDRINRALSGIRQTSLQAKELLLQLTDEEI